MLISILCVLAIVVVVGGWIIQIAIHQRLRRVNAQAVVWVRGATNCYSSLLIGNYGVPIAVQMRERGPRIRVIFPRLNHHGNIEYIHAWHGLHEIKTTQHRKRLNSDPELEIAVRIAPIIKEHLQIDAEIRHLNQHSHHINELANLVSSSSLYADRLDLYKRAIVQIDKLLHQAQKLEQIYIALIRETLIGIKVAQYNPDDISISLSDWHRQSQYVQRQHEYFQMRDELAIYRRLAITKSDGA
ncbi:MAG: hypothetical protein ACFE0I_23355 [Elainellaceae cyanobacterium]